MRTAALIFLLLTACSVDNNNTTEHNGYELVPEVKPVEIELAAPYNSKDKEYSGLAVFKNKLVLLPQYFLGFDKDSTGYLLTIDFSRIDDYLSGVNRTPIMPDSIKVYGKGLERFNHHGSGYEAITFYGDTVYVLIEDIGMPTKSFIVKGNYSEKQNAIYLHSETLKDLPQQSYVKNYGYEALVKHDDKLIAICELNGANNVANPKAHELNGEFEIVKSYSMQRIEYRITDATYCIGDKFWVINYFWPGDEQLIRPAADNIALKYGIGESQSTRTGIERILEMKISGDSVTVAAPPVYVKPGNDGSSNWEGIAKFRNGFLLITDTFPETRLVYVEP